MRTLYSRCLALFGRRRLDAQLDSEIGSHLEMLEEEFRAKGFGPKQARQAARRKFGGVAQIQEAYRDRRGIPLFETLVRDVWHGVRTLRRNPGFTFVVMLSLGLGIGANTAIYSFMDAILMRSPPVRDPESLVGIDWHMKDRSTIPRGAALFYPDPKTGFTGINFPFAFFELLKANNSVFSSLFAYSNYGAASLNLTVHGQSGLADGQFVSGTFFGGLGISPVAGRLLDSTDDRPGAPAVAVISFSAWQSRLQGSTESVGQAILINGTPFTVVGVAPPGFYGPGLNKSASVPDVYLPLHVSALLDDQISSGGPNQRYVDKTFYWVEMMGRLRPGVSVGQAQAALAPVFQQFVGGMASEKEQSNLPALFLKKDARGEGLELLRRQYSKPLYVLMSMAGLILAIACVNIANLLLARGDARRREIAVRLSMGASRARVVRQLLTESLLLASLGGIAGIVFAMWGIRALTCLLANGRDNFTLHAELNWHVLGVTIALSMLTGLLFGFAPAILATRVNTMSALKAAPYRDRAPLVSSGQGLAVVQIALSLLLVVAAGLFVRTLANLQSVEVGFDPKHMLLFTVNAKQAGYSGVPLARFYEDLQSRFTGIPGVRAVSFSSYAPLSGYTMPVRVAVPDAAPDALGRATALPVGHSFLTTMRIPTLLGREIDERDTKQHRPVAVVSQAFANTYLGAENPIGKHFRLATPLVSGSAAAEIEVIGVAKDTRVVFLKRDVPPMVYLPYSQDPRRIFSMVFELSTEGDPLAMVGTVRQLVRQADSRVPVSGIKTQSAQIEQTIGDERTLARLASCCGVLTLTIACIGLYGTTAYGVSRRTNEIGIRMALGAERWHVIWMVLREVFTLSSAGIAIGLLAAYGLSHFVQSLLFGVKSNDPMTLWVAVGILFAFGALAGFIPARRASLIDPAVSLRHE